jgi:hypothetical protein
MNTKSVILSAVAFVAVSAAASAGPSEALAFAIGQCSSQPNEKARLACYDEIATQLKAGALISAPAPQAYQPPASPPSVAQAPAAQAAVPPPPAPVAQAPAPQAPQSQGGTWYDPTSWFGKDTPQKSSTNPSDFGAEALPQQRTASADPARPARLDELRANVTAVAFNPNGRFTVTLDNGQIWKQLDGDTGTARFKNKGSDVVTISRGLLGSYNLVVEGRSALFKVKRVQ